MPSERDEKRQPGPAQKRPVSVQPPPIPLLNYSLSTVCPACNFPTIRRACKVRCERCGFVWDCSEL
jgi:transposase